MIPKLPWKMILIALGVVVALIYLVSPILTERANKRASAEVTQQSTQSIQKGAATAAKEDGKTQAKVAAIRERETTGSDRIVRAGPDAYREFLDGVCQSRLYADDPQCRGRRGDGRARDGTHGGR